MTLAIVLLLPGCFYKSTAQKSVQKKSSLNDKSEGSIFTTLSEESIRENIREHYAITKDVGFEKEGPSKRGKKISRKKKIAAALDYANELQAKLTDVPVPLDAQPIIDYFDRDNVNMFRDMVLGYQVSMSLDDIATFYQAEMERNGWKYIIYSSGLERLLHFIKPNRFCSISIRPHNAEFRRESKNADIIMFIGSTSL